MKILVKVKHPEYNIIQVMNVGIATYIPFSGHFTYWAALPWSDYRHLDYFW